MINMQRRWGAFVYKRSVAFNVSRNINFNSMVSNYENGILTVQVKKINTKQDNKKNIKVIKVN